MPMYTYVCDTCGRSCDRRTTVVDRDTPAACNSPDATPFEGHPSCPGKLVREEIALTASMAYDWSNWQ